MRQMLTNCPNCGAPLESDGTCKYCDTKVRFANEIDIQGNESWIRNPIEILFRVKQGDETILFPILGYFDTLEVKQDTTSYYDEYDVRPISVCCGTNVSFHFTGRLMDEKEFGGR